MHALFSSQIYLLQIFKRQRVKVGELVSSNISESIHQLRRFYLPVFLAAFFGKKYDFGTFVGNLQAVKKKFKRVLRFCAKKVILSFIQVLHHMSEISRVKISAIRVV